MARAEQRSRQDICRNQNQINANTIATLRKEDNGPQAARELRQESQLLHISVRKLKAFTSSNEGATIQLITALVPKRDCSKL